jgi:hypothetical protein
MSPLQTLRQAHFIARLVLVWFALSLGVAMASPLVSPQDTVMVCSSGGLVKLLPIDDASGSAALHTLDCPLCATTSAPPLVQVTVTEPVQALGHVLHSIPAARIAALTAAPLPARGPPASI